MKRRTALRGLLVPEFDSPVDSALGLFAGVNFSSFKGFVVHSFINAETAAAARFVSLLGSATNWEAEGYLSRTLIPCERESSK